MEVSNACSNSMVRNIRCSYLFINLMIKYEHVILLYINANKQALDFMWQMNKPTLIGRVVRYYMNCFRLNSNDINYQLLAARLFYKIYQIFYNIEKECCRIFVSPIHIKLASDIFILNLIILNYLYYFISRQNRCHSIHLNNKKNFIDAKNQLNE